MVFPVEEPVTSDSIARVKAKARQLIKRNAEKGKEPVLIFEFSASDAGRETTSYAAMELSSLISTGLSGAKTRVAYVTGPLKGYAVLAALACDEIVMAPDASLGPITAEGQDGDPAEVREHVRVLASRKGYDADLLLGMIDRNADLRLVKTANKQRHFVFAENLAEFQKSEQIVDDVPAWEGGQRGILAAPRAREMGFVKLIAENPSEVANAYHLTNQSAANDPTLGQTANPVWIQIQGPIDSVKQSYLRRRIEQARQEKVNLVFFQINSMGGRSPRPTASPT